MVKRGQPSGVTRRGLSLGLLGLQLTGSYLGYQLERLLGSSEEGDQKQKAFRQKASRRIRAQLENLKGPAMKAGQVLSMAGEIVPEELVQEMTELQMHAPAMHSALARAQFKGSYGKYPEEVFAEFTAEPFAAASLGQVHRAVTRKGETVAVKIQYPAIKQTIENDFKLIRSATLPGQLTGHIPKAILDELEHSVLEETDYLKEGRNIELFGEQLRELEFVHVPKVYWRYTTDRVLTMSFLEGAPLHQFLAGRPSTEVRDVLGERLLKMFLFQIHKMRRFHADPHPGNYLFTDNGEINLVDFGCVKVLSSEFGELIDCFLTRAWRKGPEQFNRMMWLLWGKEVPATDKSARKILELEIELFELVFPKQSRRVSLENPRIFELGLQIRKECLSGKLAQAEFPLYARAELGLYNMIRQLKAMVDTNKLLADVCRT